MINGRVKLKLLFFTILFILLILIIPNLLNNYSIQYEIRKGFNGVIDNILPWQCSKVPEVGLKYCFPHTWSSRFEIGSENLSDSGISSAITEVTILFYTNITYRLDPNIKEVAGITFSLLPKADNETAPSIIHRFFNDKDNDLVIVKSQIQVGNSSNVYYVKDDTAYLRKYKQIFPISQKRLFIETKHSIWDYETLYQNPTFDISPYEKSILKSLNFQN